MARNVKYRIRFRWKFSIALLVTFSALFCYSDEILTPSISNSIKDNFSAQAVQESKIEELCAPILNNQASDNLKMVISQLAEFSSVFALDDDKRKSKRAFKTKLISASIKNTEFKQNPAQVMFDDQKYLLETRNKDLFAQRVEIFNTVKMKE